MPEQDALSAFDFSKVTNAGLFLKFQPGEPVTVRVLTVDPVISESEFTDRTTNEISLNTRFAFIVYNFTDNKAQIMQVTANTARKIGEIHRDDDFGANIRQIDLKITPPNKNEIKAYDIQVLPKPRQLTNEQIKEAQAIDLDNNVRDTKGRMSTYNQDLGGEPVGKGGSGQAKARAQADKIRNRSEDDETDDAAAEAYKREAEKEHKPPEHPDPIIEDIGEEPINLDDIPF